MNEPQNKAKYTISSVESQALAELSPARASSLSAAELLARDALAVVWDAERARVSSRLDITEPRPGTCPPSLLDTCRQVGRPGLAAAHQVGKKTGQVYQNDRASHTIFKRALAQSLEACGRNAEAEAVGHCGDQFKVGKCQDCGAYPAFPTSCKHRLCPDCAARRGSLLVSEHESLLKGLRYPKMLTLTFLSVLHLTRGFLRWARNCFTRLRHRKIFEGCWGGIYSFEATYTKGVGWHLHIHAVIGSKYIPQAELSAEWEKITGAWDVDIRAIHGDDKWPAIQEVVKYPAKAATFVDNPALVDEFLKATEGVSLAYGFGAMYRVRTKEHGSQPLVCPMCGGTHIKWLGLVDRSAVQRTKDGYTWAGPIRGPPGGGVEDG